jgi:hypothetical protein
MTVKAEITFMVNRTNGRGHLEKRVMELTDYDFNACNRVDRNEKLKGWLIALFPAAREVKIQAIRRI